MPRCALIVALVLHPAFTRLAAAQDTLSDTLTDSLRYRFQLEGHWLRRLPIDDPRHALVLIPGVRLTGADLGVTAAAALMIRGSPAGRSNVYVDGAPLRFETQGGAGVGLAPNAIEALSVLTGAAPVTFADAGGGVIAYETRGGGEHLAGNLRWDSDEPFSDASTVGYNRIEATVGGPLARGGKLTFFLSTTLQGQRSSYRGRGASDVPASFPAGVDTTVAAVNLPLWEAASSGLWRPLDWSTARRAQMKVAFRYAASSVASLTVITGDVQEREFPGQRAQVPALYTGARLSSTAAIVNWQHPLGTWRGGRLTLDVNLSMVRHRDISGPLDSSSALGTRDPALGIVFGRLRFAGAGILGLPTDAALVRELRSQSGTRGVPFFGGATPTQAFRTNPYGMVGSWPTHGLGGTLRDAAERRFQGRWSLGWRPSAGRQIAVGVDIERSQVASYFSDVVVQSATEAFAAHPKRLGLFSDARLTVAEAAIDIGVRYDRITPGGDLPIVPGYIASSGPALWNPNAATDDTAYARSVARVFRTAGSQSVLAPRIRFAYPLAARTLLRLGYSRNVEPPAWRTFFARSNTDLAFTNSADLFGRDFEFAVANLLEGGIRFVVGSTVLDVGVYRKDLPTYVGRLAQFRDPRDTTRVIAVNALTRLETARAQGIELGIDWREGWVTASGAYVFARITTSPEAGIAPRTAPVTTLSAAIALSVEIPSDWRSGSLLGTIGQGTNIAVLARAQNGEPYTRLANAGLGTIAPSGGVTSFPLGEINSSVLPWFKRLDLRIAKGVRAGGRHWSLYVDARNLLAFANLSAVFAETGTASNALHMSQTIGDPSFGTGQYGVLWNEATSAGALDPGNTVDLTGCATWASPVNCVALTRVERRFGDGDRLFTLAEQQRAFEAYYRDFFGAWRFYAPGRTIRIGMELSL